MSKPDACSWCGASLADDNDARDLGSGVIIDGERRGHIEDWYCGNCADRLEGGEPLVGGQRG